MLKNLYRLKWLRKAFLPIFSRVNLGDIKIQHHYTGDRVKLHSFRHKGYWFHGAKREAETMNLFQRLLSPGQVVFEVGGHIGYISLYFHKLVEPGTVIVFEPGINNLPYLRENLKGTNVEIVEKAVGKKGGSVKFYLDDLTGQNNSVVSDFAGLEANAAAANVNVNVKAVDVDVVSLDAFCRERDLYPDLVKIDVEGYELSVLLGAVELFQNARPIFMVEVQADHGKIFELFERAGYRLFSDNMEERLVPSNFTENLFCFHGVNHSGILAKLEEK